MSNLINLSEAASIALHGMALIAQSKQNRMNVHLLAETLDSSPAHLAKVFQKLSKADLVKSVRGPAGGFELNKSSDEINFLDIYEAIEGKVVLSACPLGKEKCAFKLCIFSSELNRISTDIYNTYKSLKLSSF